MPVIYVNMFRTYERDLLEMVMTIPNVYLSASLTCWEDLIY